MSHILHRQEQIHLLFDYLKGWPPASLHISGTSGTGKSCTVKAVLDQSSISYAILNCVECCISPNVLMNEVLFHLYKFLGNTDFADGKRITNPTDFVLSLKSLFSTNESDKTMVLIFDRSERLAVLPANIAVLIFRLQDIVSAPICCIFISERSWLDNAISGVGLHAPLQVHFPAYRKEQLKDIICLDKPKGADENGYRKYCSLIVDTLLIACQDLKELKYIAKTNYAKYCEPIARGEAADENDSRILYKYFQPDLTHSMLNVYLRQHSGNELHQNGSDKCAVKSKTAYRQRELVELPLSCKFLLIAGYLASRNPAKSDVRFFLKFHGKQKRKVKRVKKNSRINKDTLKGGKAFPLDRLLAIFSAISDLSGQEEAAVFLQISALLRLGLFSEAHAGDTNIDAPKYRCNVSWEFIEALSRNVGFNLEAHLHDSIL